MSLVETYQLFQKVSKNRHKSTPSCNFILFRLLIFIHNQQISSYQNYSDTPFYLISTNQLLLIKILINQNLHAKHNKLKILSLNLFSQQQLIQIIQFYKSKFSLPSSVFTQTFYIQKRKPHSSRFSNSSMQGLHIRNSQNQKIYDEFKFLQAQNQRLKDQLSDARDLIQMNKIQIDVLSKQKSHDNKLIDVIYNYRQQIQGLQAKKTQLHQSFKKISSEKLVVEQLNQQLQSEQKSIEDLYKHRVQQLLDVIKGLEQKIHNCQRSHQNYDSITGFVEKNRDVFNPLQQALEFKNKEDMWNEEMTYIKDQLNEHKNNQQNLLLANGVLRNKVVSLQAKLAMPNKNLGEILDKSLKRLMLYFIETQKKMLTGDQSDSDEEDLQLIAPQLIELFPHKDLNSQSDIKVPALNILKVRNQQMKGNEKIKQQLLRRNHLSKDQKIDQLQKELEFTRRCLTKNMIQFKSQHERRILLQRICEQLQERNQLLLKSNEGLKAKLDKIRKDYLSNKEKNHQFLISFDDQDIETKKKISKEKNIQNLKLREFQVNKYLQNVETPFQYKLHLQLLAKDLNKNPKLKDLKQKKLKKSVIEPNGEADRPRLKKSTSNPFLYFNERRDQIMEIQPQNEKQKQQKESNERLQQTEFLFMGQNNVFKFNEDLDDFDDT